jgi:hypothetical protein
MLSIGDAKYAFSFCKETTDLVLPVQCPQLLCATGQSNADHGDGKKVPKTKTRTHFRNIRTYCDEESCKKQMQWFRKDEDLFCSSNTLSDKPERAQLAADEIERLIDCHDDFDGERHRYRFRSALVSKKRTKLMKDENLQIRTAYFLKMGVPKS